jgi:acyl-CoA thioesterase
MNSLAFFGLERVGYRRWRMPVVRGLISGTGALFGGAGLGAAIEVAEQETHRPVVWATAQYLSYAPEGHELELDVDEVVRGRMTSQVRVIARSEGCEILTVVGAFGDRPVPANGQWSRMPDVPPPEDCPPRPMMDRHENTISSRMEMLLASARPFTELPGPDAPGAASGGSESDGNSALWVRFPGLSELKASGLAIIGDFVPFGIGQALGRRAGGNSLDNTLRVARLEDCDWILADIRVHAVQHGFGHGLVHLWTQDGVLLGTASQSTMVREWKDEPPAAEELK